MPRITSATVSLTARMAGGRIVAILVLVGSGLVLGACSKCDVPDWFHTNRAPRVCHGDTPAQ